MNLKKVTEKARKDYDKQLRKMSKIELKEMAEIMDRILAEGVENLESPGGRKKFLENLRKMDFKTRDSEILANIDETIPNLEKMVAPEVNEWVHQIVSYDKLDFGMEEEEKEMTLLLLPSGLELDVEMEEYDLINKETLDNVFLAQVGAAIEVRRRERDVANLLEVRQNIRRRAREGEIGEGLNTVREVIGCIRKYKLREKAAVDYSLNEKTQPNWKQEATTPERDPISRVMERKRRMDYQRYEVRESLLENAGQGLYARKNMKEMKLYAHMKEQK